MNAAYATAERRRALASLRQQSSRWPLPWSPDRRMAVAYALAAILAKFPTVRS